MSAVEVSMGNTGSRSVYILAGFHVAVMRLLVEMARCWVKSELERRNQFRAGASIARVDLLISRLCDAATAQGRKKNSENDRWM
jgi:hypothetical protein